MQLIHKHKYLLFGLLLNILHINNLDWPFPFTQIIIKTILLIASAIAWKCIIIFTIIPKMTLFCNIKTKWNPLSLPQHYFKSVNFNNNAVKIICSTRSWKLIPNIHLLHLPLHSSLTLKQSTLRKLLDALVI